MVRRGGVWLAILVLAMAGTTAEGPTSVPRRGMAEPLATASDLAAPPSIAVAAAKEAVPPARVDPGAASKSPAADLYLRAETLRVEKERLATALEAYGQVVRQFPESPYAAPALLHASRCLLALGGVEEAGQRYRLFHEDDLEGLARDEALLEAERRLRAFHEADPDGLYRGEALLLLGRIALEERLDPAEAKMRFEQLDAWIARVREAVGEEALRSPPDAGRPKVRPGQLVNRETAWWYLHRLAEQCYMYLGFMRFAEGDNEASLATYERIKTLPALARTVDDTTSRYNDEMFNDYSRVTFGPKHGYLVAYPEELAVYTEPRHRLAILLMDFFHLTHRFADSGRLAKRMLRGEFGPLTPRQGQYPQLLYAKSVYWGRDLGNAYQEFMKVLEMGEEKFGTFTQCRAGFCAGNISRRSQQIQEAGHELLRELAYSGRKNKWVWEARIRYAQNLINRGQREEGLRILREFPDDDPNYRQQADYWVGWYEKLQKQQEEQKP